MMKRTGLIKVLVSSCVVAICSLALSWAQQGFEGRWDLTEKSGDRTSASWLRITHQEGQEWKALFLHRGGHPLPADVQINGNQIQIQVVAESNYTGRADVQWPSLTGTLQNGKLQGTGTERNGGTFTWEGERAPDRTEGSFREVTWGTPVPLFSGQDMNSWQVLGSRESKWKVIDGILTNEDSGANIRSKQEFRDFKLHIEFRIPKGSNSGIYLRGRYESQVADEFGREPFIRMVGGIYGQISPIVNASKPAGEWNILDATLIGYRVTIQLNGHTTTDGQLIDGITGGALSSDERAPGPIMLQGDHGAVYYRNIVVTPAR